MLILDLYISFHAVVVFGLGKNLLFKSTLDAVFEYLDFWSKILFFRTKTACSTKSKYSLTSKFLIPFELEKVKKGPGAKKSAELDFLQSKIFQ